MLKTTLLHPDILRICAPHAPFTHAQLKVYISPDAAGSVSLARADICIARTSSTSSS